MISDLDVWRAANAPLRRLQLSQSCVIYCEYIPDNVTPVRR